MPTLSRVGVYVSLVWLIAGSMLGGLLLGGPLVGWPLRVGPLVRVHIDAMLFGWLLQVTVSVAWWILPRRAEARGTWRAGSDGRGPVPVAAVALGAFNAAILVSTSGHMLTSQSGVVLGRSLTLSALLVFLILLRPRVRAFGESASRSPD